MYFADPNNPQSFNLYAYALNNPLKNTDPTGMYCYYGDTGDGPASWHDLQDASQFDYHSNQKDCTQADENGNQGQWIDDAGTHYDINLGGVDNADRQENYMLQPAEPAGVPGATPLDTASVSLIDPDQARIDALVQGVAVDTASMPWVCNASVSLQAQVPNTWLSVGMSADRTGVNPSAKLGATTQNGGAFLTTNGKKVGFQATVPVTPFWNASLSAGSNQATVGVSKKYNFGPGKVSAGASLTFGYLGDSHCR